MKVIGVILFLIAQAGWAEVLKARSYRVSLSVFGEAYREVVEDFEIEYHRSDWLGEVVKDAPFESRYLQGVNKMRDCSARVGELLGRKEFKGSAVYDVEGEQLILKAGEDAHEELVAELGDRFPKMIRTEVEIYSVPGVVRGKREMFWDAPPKGAKMLTSLSCLHLPGQPYSTKVGKWDFEMEGMATIDVESVYVESSASWKVGFPEAHFSWKTAFAIPLGMPFVHEVGSVDGKKTVLAVMRHDLMRMDGTLFDEWVLKEEEGAFLREERLKMVAHRAASGGLPVDDERGFRVYSVPPTFEMFMNESGSDGNGEPDPFDTGGGDGDLKAPIYEGEHPELENVGRDGLYDCEELLKRNGLSFQDGDFAVYRKKGSKLYAKLSKENLERLGGIIIGRGSNEPRSIRVDLLQVELKEGGGKWKPGDGKVLRKVGMNLLPGQAGTVMLGDDLAAELEGQIDANEKIVELRATLSEKEKDLKRPSFRTGATLLNGAPVTIYESRQGGKRKAWVVRANIVTMDEVLEGYLRGAER